jgi:hypothetical protein
MIGVVFSIACSLNPKVANSAAAPDQNSSPSAIRNSVANETQSSITNGTKTNSAVITSKTESKSVADNCPPVTREGKHQIKSQTFPFNFKPFTDACFVTLASVEEMMDEKDVPRGSTFHIYRNGSLVLDLPDAFDGQTGCWVNAVSFKDLNGDGLTDITMAGSCLGAKDSYPSNAIYANNGQSFTTDAEANQKLENFKKLSEIEGYVKKNQKLFF